MPTAVRSPIMAIPCIPIRGTPLLGRPTDRVLETSGSLPPPISRRQQPRHQGVPLHLVGTISLDIPYASACPPTKALPGGNQDTPRANAERASGVLSGQRDDDSRSTLPFHHCSFSRVCVLPRVH